MLSSLLSPYDQNYGGNGWHCSDKPCDSNIDLSNLKNELQECQRKLKEGLNKSQIAPGLLEKHKQEILDANKELDVLKKQMSDITNQHTVNIDQKQVELKRLAAEIEKQRSVIDEQYKIYLLNKTKIEGLETNNKTLTDTIEKLTVDIKSERDNYSTKISDINLKYKEDIDKIHDELRNEKVLLEVAEENIRELHLDLNNVTQNLTNARTAASANNTDAKTALEDLQTEKDDLLIRIRKANASVTNCQKTINDLEDNVTRLTGERDGLQINLDNVTGERDSVRQAFKLHQLINSQVTSNLENRIQSEKYTVNKQKDTYLKNLDIITNERDTAQGERETAINNLKILNRQLELLQADVNRLEMENGQNLTVTKEYKEYLDIAIELINKYNPENTRWYKTMTTLFGKDDKTHKLLEGFRKLLIFAKNMQDPVGGGNTAGGEPNQNNLQDVDINYKNILSGYEKNLDMYNMNNMEKNMDVFITKVGEMEVLVKDLIKSIESKNNQIKNLTDDRVKLTDDRDNLTDKLKNITSKHTDCSNKLSELEQKLQQLPPAYQQQGTQSQSEQGNVYSQSQSEQQLPQEYHNCSKNIKKVQEVKDRYTHFIQVIKKINDFITENKDAIESGRKMKTEHIKTYDNKKCVDNYPNNDRQYILNSPEINCRNKIYYMKLDVSVFNIILSNLQNYQNEIQNFINTANYTECNDLNTTRLNALEYQFNEIIGDLKLKEVINDLEVFTDSVRVYIRINKGKVDKYQQQYQDPDEVSVLTDGQNIRVTDIIDLFSYNCKLEEDKIYDNFYTVYPPELNNQQIFENTGNAVMEPMNTVFNELNIGYNIIIFGYGYSGSGKTHTLFGNQNELGIIQQALNGLDPSIVKVVIEDIYDLYGELYTGQHVEQIKNKPKVIHEGIRDSKMHTPEDFKRNKNKFLFHTPDTSDINNEHIGKEITSSNINNIMDKINSNRRDYGLILPTKNNPESSRSHLFVTFNITLKGGGNSKLTVVDTAGIEDPFDLFKVMLPKYSHENRFNYYFIPALFAYDFDHLIRFLSFNDIDYDHINKLKETVNDIELAINIYVKVVLLYDLLYNPDIGRSKTYGKKSVIITKEILVICRSAISRYDSEFNELSDISRISMLTTKPNFYKTYISKWARDDNNNKYNTNIQSGITNAYYKFYNMSSDDQQLYMDYKNTASVIKQSFFINESLNHLKYYFQNKSKYFKSSDLNDIKSKLGQIGSLPNSLFEGVDNITKSIKPMYAINKSFMNPKEIMAHTLSTKDTAIDEVGMISKLHNLNAKEVGHEDNPTKYILMGLVNPAPNENQCDATRKTLDFAVEIKSS
jgi:DNA repair exonuclease SbcCD ATPase subunit